MVCVENRLLLAACVFSELVTCFVSVVGMVANARLSKKVTNVSHVATT